MPCWFIGTRDAGAAYHFIHDLKSRLATRVQLTTDGHKAYLNAVEDAFGADVDYAMLVKIYGTVPENGEVRYSPAICMGAKRTPIIGTPDHAHVSTSICERQNLTMRMAAAKKQVADVAAKIRDREFVSGPTKKTGDGKHRCYTCDFLGFCGMKQAVTYRQTVS